MAGSGKSKGTPGKAKRWLVRGLKISVAAGVAGLAAALVVVLDLALIGGMASLIWHERYEQLKQAILSRVEARVGSHRSVVAKVIAERKDKRERDADTEKAEQLRRKALTVEAASKTCNALAQRVKELKVEMPELRQEIDSIGGAVARLDSLIGASKERATAVHRQWSRGELKQKLRALAHGAGVVRARVERFGWRATESFEF